MFKNSSAHRAARLAPIGVSVLVLLGALVSAQPASAAAPAASAEGVSTGTVYKVVNRNSGLVLDVQDDSTSNGANVQQWGYYGASNQQWTVVAVGGGKYKIQNVNSGLVLDVADDSTSHGGNVQQWGYYGARNQQWKLVHVGHGYYKIKNVNSRLVLDVAGSSTSNGGNVDQDGYSHGSNQQWSLVPVTPTSGGGSTGSGGGSTGSGGGSTGSGTIGRFNVAKDLLISHHDNGSDLDDANSVAAEGTFLTNTKYSGVQSFLVSGTVPFGYGGSQYDMSSIANLAYPNRWANAQANWSGAVSQEASKIEATLAQGGNVWIAEGGSSDFTSDVVNKVKADQPTANTKGQIHVVQSSTYNQNQLTDPTKLQNVENNTDYLLIPSNYTSYTSYDTALWTLAEGSSRVGNLWTTTKSLLDRLNGTTGYNDQPITAGGMALEDTTEMDYIFQWNLPSMESFFQTFL